MNDPLSDVLKRPGRTLVAGAPDGYDALVLARLVRARGDVLHVARDDGRLARLADAVAFFDPGIEVLEFPAWDCVPYDRVGPHPEIVGRRIDTLSRLAERQGKEEAGGQGPRLVLTTVAAALQRVVPAALLAGARFELESGRRVDLAALQAFFQRNGYSRTETVMEQGEYALRGGIVDLFPPGAAEPLRLDLFGDEIEQLRHFDPMTQRSTERAERAILLPAGEVVLDETAIARFRSAYRELFGAPAAEDQLYEAVSAGMRHPGMEHWLPLFHDGLDTLFAYLPDAAVTLDPQADEAIDARRDQIAEYFQARRAMQARPEAGGIYNPIPPRLLHIEPAEWDRLLATRPVAALWAFPPAELAEEAIDAGGRRGHDFADLRAQRGGNLYEGVIAHIKAEQAAGRRVAVAAWTAGSAQRLGAVLSEHGLVLTPAESWEAALALPAARTPLLVLPIEHGFADATFAVIGEQDILGDRLVRPPRKRRQSARFLVEAADLAEGDLVVHVDYGIGRYDGLVTIDVAGAPHDCVRVIYEGGDRLHVPVENIEVLSRFGSEQAGVALDKLGGVAWQNRKARMKKRIREIAEQLIAVAARRKLDEVEVVRPPEGLYDEFCARFPYAETEDQERAIADTLGDLAAGRPMDRLICGDVGFGKTEVALRAAFLVAMEGQQVAVVVPTTLLSRQHFATFKERFSGLPVRIAQLSRLVPPREAAETKAALKEGGVDILVGTHAILAKDVEFKRLGLLVVDEEQHFGVAHKERLKAMRARVHVLTLTATPIPRTLQMALSGVREMSVMATPPVDRLAVRTFVLPYDGVVVREALLRERYRGGQSFYVCPRLEDIDRVLNRLRELVPELKVAIAHGRLSPTAIEGVMSEFATGVYDVLLSTNIIESGLDMPRVNTIVIHRADMFGLSQLYQLRGRVGRGKQRGYCYLTVPSGRLLAKTAERRLEVMQTLDGLGAGFQLASHDLDLRGAGNLLGEEQSGHIREVGVELYQNLLEEAVAAARAGKEGGVLGDTEWTSSINVGMPVLIPDSYVGDLSVRLALYRRLGTLADRAEIEGMAAELVDRFGKLPREVENLLQVVAVKVLCKAAGIEKVDAGPRGAVFAFRDNRFANPAGLVRLIAQQPGMARLRPDHRLVFQRSWEDPAVRLDGLRRLAETLAGLASEGAKAA